MTYQEKQEKWVEIFDLKAGDKVIISQSSPSNENGWSNSWESEMDAAIGKVGTIKSTSMGTGGISVHVEEIHSTYRYPFYVLVPLVKPSIKFQATPGYKGVVEGDYVIINDERIHVSKLKELKDALETYKQQL